MPPQAAADHVLRQEPRATVIVHGMSEDDVRSVMAHPSTMIGSDGIPSLDGKPHPRLYGTFARVLGRYARELGILRLEEAIYKMTGFPAKKFGLEGRGRIAVGAFADLVLFDAKTIIDVGTFADPNQLPKGIRQVLVNGQVVVANGTHHGSRSGKVLTPT